MLLTERQAKDVECETGDEAAQNAVAVESNTESSSSVEEQDTAAEDAKPVEEASKDEAEADAVYVEKAVSETVSFVISGIIVGDN